MTGPSRSSDPRTAADDRDVAAAARDDCADQRDARSRDRDSAAGLRDDAARTRDDAAAPERVRVLSRLRTLREHLAGGAFGQAPPGAVVVTADEAAAARSVLDDAIALLERTGTVRAQSAGDRRDAARDRLAAAQDRGASGRDRDDSAADRDQACIDREQADHRIDFGAVARQAEAGRDATRTWVDQATLSSQDRIAESRRILAQTDRRSRRRGQGDADAV
ncbi:hypothetical protein ACFQ34_17515 [Pseudonocardia benzenivorans]|uniref:DUF222 domain-containing protein n=1 Tax=Pseudonocardia benzenivorans TaxID=228005 RepID=A0ABW3VIG7_9PSEU|nr:hypothetical protein PSD17_11140 [Pseudonocardia sp. D17]